MTTDHRAPVELAWTPELEDYVDGFRARNRGDRVLRVLALLGLAALVTSVAALAGGRLDVVPLGVGAAAGLLVVPFSARLSTRAMWRRGLLEHRPTTARVLPGVGVLTDTDGSTTRTQWSHLPRVLETPRSFVLPVGRQRLGFVVVLPKRGLRDPRDVDRLRALLRDETGAAPDLVPSPAGAVPEGVTAGPADRSAPGDAVVLRWLPEVQDYVEACEARRRSHRSRRLTVLLSAAGLLVVGALVAREPTALVLAVLAVAWLAANGPVTRRAVRRSWAREPGLQEARTARVTPADGLVVETGTSAGRYGWDRVARVVETERSFVLLRDRAWSGTFWLLAKRGAGSPDDVDRLRALLARHVGSTPATVGQVGLEPTTDGL